MLIRVTTEVRNKSLILPGPLVGGESGWLGKLLVGDGGWERKSRAGPHTAPDSGEPTSLFRSCSSKSFPGFIFSASSLFSFLFTSFCFHHSIRFELSGVVQTPTSASQH